MSLLVKKQENISASREPEQEAKEELEAEPILHKN